MKISILWLFVVMVFINGCNSSSKFGFTSSDCSEVYSTCMNKCTPNSKRSECINNCSKSKAMCESIKVKGCMQDCNTKYKKGTQNAELCKRRCADNSGISF